MKIKNEAKERELAPEGTHSAVCVRILDMGTQSHPEWGDKRKLNFAFELLEEQTTEGEPFLVYKSYTASLSNKATLAKDIKSWTGATINRGDELDLEDLLGKSCLVTVIHSEETKDGAIYANVDTITGVPKGTKVKKATVDLFSLYLDDTFDQKQYDELPDFLKDRISKSPEYQALTDKKPSKKSVSKPIPETKKKRR